MGTIGGSEVTTLEGEDTGTSAAAGTCRDTQASKQTIILKSACGLIELILRSNKPWVQHVEKVSL